MGYTDTASHGAWPHDEAGAFMASLRSPRGMTCSGFLFALPECDNTGCDTAGGHLMEMPIRYVMTVAHFFGPPPNDQFRVGMRRIRSGMTRWWRGLFTHHNADDRMDMDSSRAALALRPEPIPHEDTEHHAERISVRIGGKYYYSTCYARVPATDIAILKLDRPVFIQPEKVPVLDCDGRARLLPGRRFAQYGFGAKRLVHRRGRLLFPLPWAGSRGLSTRVRHAYFTHVNPKVVRGDSGGPILRLSPPAGENTSPRLIAYGVQSMIHDPWGIDVGIAVIARIYPHREAIAQVLGRLESLDG